MSPNAVLRLQRSSLRRLIDSGESGACDGAAAAAAAIAGTATGGDGLAEPPDDGAGTSPSASAGRGADDGEAPAAGRVLADTHLGGPGIDLGDGEEAPVETLLFFLLTLLAVLGPLVLIALLLQRRAAAVGDKRPLLFLDIDGVIALSVFSNRLPPGEMRNTEFGVIHIPDRAGDLLRTLASRFDLVWATGWEHAANSDLGGPLGLREELPVLTFGKKARSGPSDWKIKRVSAHARRRPAAWVDDSFAARHERWAAHRSEPTLLMPVDANTGLTEDHVERLLRWAGRLEASQAAEANGLRRTRAN